MCVKFGNVLGDNGVQMHVARLGVVRMWVVCDENSEWLIACS